MKTTSIIIVLMTLAHLVWAGQFTSVKGTVKMEKNPEEISLFRVVDGNIMQIATTRVGNSGTFGFLFEPDGAGFYTVGTKDLNHILYVLGGEEVNIDLYDKEAKLNGKNTKENKALYRWEEFSQNIRLKSVYFWLTQSTYKDFFPEFVEFAAQLPAFKQKLQSGNKDFDALLSKMIDYDVDYYAIMFLQTPRTEHPKKEQRPDFYKTIISDRKFVNDEVLQFPRGVSMLSCYASYGFESAGRQYTTPEDYIRTGLSFLHHDRLKGEFVLSSEFARYKTYEQYLAGIEAYGQYFVTPSLKTRAEAIGTKLYDTRAGGVAADFTYPDVNGKEVSLSDFKGKVVLVDVWATWCGPCRGEIPHLKKLEQEMHGTDVVFLGVSVDEAKDKQKWLDFIKKEELAGVQLLASGWSKITKDYKITGIPRFMVFDKKGNIVSVDAPRPSNPELKKLLLKTLEE